MGDTVQSSLAVSMIGWSGSPLPAESIRLSQTPRNDSVHASDEQCLAKGGSDGGDIAMGEAIASVNDSPPQCADPPPTASVQKVSYASMVKGSTVGATEITMVLWMRMTVIVRLLGRSIGYRVLWNKIKALWQPQGNFQLIDLDNNYYLVHLENEGDYTRVLTDGPWVIFSDYLIVQPWSRDFSTSEDHPSKVIVRIHLLGLPYQYYSKALFKLIGSEVGNVIKVDYNTNVGRGLRGKDDLGKRLKQLRSVVEKLGRVILPGLQRLLKTGHSGNKVFGS
ncbi:hypothetical protein F3Y22_tig00110722pilonHSYRG00004 [Hibiscus syriacus]|uniref:DUF4283 domain-containing protein n=1 Tax=Hibiscus syriacus TaxID=106335 RepID=A0A6A2ZTS4_HIBSY|nr:hypothetical protein F3Y22_tig00110722pilonHSYRG00004 [Hibiscus syriacus]